LSAKGTGYAVIRFLPAAHGQPLHWVREYSHGFKSDSGKWFIESCPTTLGHDCPVCEANSELWNTGLKSNQEIVRQRKRKETFYYNVYVRSHPDNPEDEGTVRIFKSGPTIYKMLLAAQKPEFPGDPVIDVFDPWNGADFILKIYKDENGNVKYDKSAVAAPSSLASNDAGIEAIWNQAHNLGEFIAPSRFKSSDELRTKLHQVLGTASTSSGRAAITKSEPAPSIGQVTQEPISKKTAPVNTGDEEDDPLKMFEDLAKGD
ncbi:MAG: single-stranded DNA-binding protein, partial [Nitrososphaera sp.]|nr:single-stranded DNA-binding protein [Nitrososphaera sp.]